MIREFQGWQNVHSTQPLLFIYFSSKKKNETLIAPSWKRPLPITLPCDSIHEQYTNHPDQRAYRGCKETRTRVYTTLSLRLRDACRKGFTWSCHSNKSPRDHATHGFSTCVVYWLVAMERHFCWPSLEMISAFIQPHCVLPNKVHFYCEIVW